MEAIKDLDIYNARMRKSIYDKLWFVDKLPDNISYLYDYGCGDGTLLSMAKAFLPEGCIVKGYDCNPEMANRARIRLGNEAIFYNPAKRFPAGTCLVASSVFHEIYNYSENVEKELQNIFDVGADYIAIRDMFYNSGNIYPSYSDVKKVREVFSGENRYMLDQFEAEYGSIERERNFIHFLLKCRYVENWNRELKENYFPYSLAEFYDMIPKKYKIVYHEQYTLPFLQKCIKKDFNIDLCEPTHAKLLLKRVK